MQTPPKLPSEGKYNSKQAWLAVREWHYPDTVPYMKRKAMGYFAPRLAFWISLSSVAGHSFWAAISHCSVNFQRGGAIVVLVAAALYSVVEWHEPRGGLLDGGSVQQIWFYNPAFLLPLLGAIGTLIWGYGDLIPFFGSAGCSSPASMAQS